jgi:hypothetical protein
MSFQSLGFFCYRDLLVKDRLLRESQDREARASVSFGK